MINTDRLGELFAAELAAFLAKYASEGQRDEARDKLVWLIGQAVEAGKEIATESLSRQCAEAVQAGELVFRLRGSLRAKAQRLRAAKNSTARAPAHPR